MERTPHRLALAAAVAVALASALVAGGGVVAQETGAGKSAPRAAAPVDLNRAAAEELAQVPGIGPVLAQRIVDWREENGPFRRIEDLLKVKGIGETSLAKLRPHVTVATPKSS